MNSTLCVLLVYNDNGSVQTLCITRVKIHFIYLHCFMYLDCVLSIAVFEKAVFIVIIQRYAQLMEDPRKNSSVRQQPCRHKYKENFHISFS